MRVHIFHLFHDHTLQTNPPTPHIESRATTALLDQTNEFFLPAKTLAPSLTTLATITLPPHF